MMMLNQWILLLSGLIAVLIAAQLLTNALEHGGQRMGISEGLTGSLFAAIATALPETSIPILAILTGGPNRGINEEVSVGAILGAPLMLSTLSICLIGLSVIIQRGAKGRLKPEFTGFIRDLDYFLCAFLVSAIAMYVPAEYSMPRIFIALFLIAWYARYVLQICRASKGLVQHGHGVSPDRPLYFGMLWSKHPTVTILTQSALALCLLILGAKLFIHSIEAISVTIRVSPLVLSLFIIPIATELPEKVNSIVWARKGKDSMALGNITGAMVFQGTLLPALGIFLTPWKPSPEVFVSIAITLVACGWLRICARQHGIPILVLMVNGALYVGYLTLSVFVPF